MTTAYKAAPDIDVITSNITIPGLGTVPANAFVLHGSEPILVDTGVVSLRDEFMATLRSVIEPGDLKWIWLTHTDFDHVGNLGRLLADYPALRVITTFLGVGIMSLSDPLPMDRVYLVNPGQKVTVGDRTLTAVKPPLFDNPCTTGFHDSRSGAFFSSDCFGALLQDVPRDAADLSDEQLRQGQITWATIDSPWLHKADRGALAEELRSIRSMEPTRILSSHLPPASGRLLERMTAALAAAPAAPPFVGPDQAALEQMLAQMAPPSATGGRSS